MTLESIVEMVRKLSCPELDRWYQACKMVKAERKAAQKAFEQEAPSVDGASAM